MTNSRVILENTSFVQIMRQTMYNARLDDCLFVLTLRRLNGAMDLAIFLQGDRAAFQGVRRFALVG